MVNIFTYIVAMHISCASDTCKLSVIIRSNCYMQVTENNPVFFLFLEMTPKNVYGISLGATLEVDIIW